ncbi:Fpg/Nei family DNA glycosylase [Tsukamurella sp. 8F]|uniref:Fpg/Nei family DNA glycosylase n=1 Tax=unclassified Tsukamurella TaxID=2633480 RepID=UPI0023B9BD49|nr:MULTISPECIES: zinc finger domain-containing protein [unclassified Tsukamurella]MDF0529691.1 Fpg/Nei family DNA glycosylase [Tsukamurella sp. 8J]MDF0585976.1 Fpg/Nei family DNA glycosylase [Tsukamurella sp. 8F]
MPEGHTLHRLARDHTDLFAGRRVAVSSPQGRFAAEAARVDGLVFERAEAWGKHLWHHYTPDRRGAAAPIVHVHLGLYGTFTDFDRPEPPVGQVRMRIAGPDGGTDLRGPTACELVTEEQVDAVLARLGPDPLRSDADPEAAWRRISKSARPIGALLMDQKVIAGVGNVYRAEVLFRAGIDPYRPGRAVTREEFDALWADLVALMPIGVERGRMHVVRAEHDHGAPSYAPDRPRTYVYRRAGEPCRVCGRPVVTEVMDARNLFRCPTCQT